MHVRDNPVTTCLSVVCLLVSIIYPTRVRGQNQSDYNDVWNNPTISHYASHYQYQYFAEVSANDRHPRVDVRSLPPIRGLKYRSCYYMCPIDTCFANRAVIALRCPNDPLLRKWVSSRAEWFEKWCEGGDFYVESSNSGGSFSSNGGLLNYYISKIDRSFKNMQCEHTGADANSQFALLITDCWSVGAKYTTFYEASWYDNLSACNTVRESYYSIDRTTGEVASIADIVKEGKMPELAEIMMEYLKDSSGNLWIDDEVHQKENPLSILRAMDGCAFIREGLVIYYHPYHIGSGVESQITAILPYDRIKEILKVNPANI